MLTSLVTVIALLATAAVASTASAGDRRDVEVSRQCSAGSEVELDLSEEDGRIEVELEVDQDRSGVKWRIVLRQKSKRVFTGTRRTRGPSGSFELRRVLPNRPGRDRIAARATRPGEVCRIAATW